MKSIRAIYILSTVATITAIMSANFAFADSSDDSQICHQMSQNIAGNVSEFDLKFATRRPLFKDTQVLGAKFEETLWAKTDAFTGLDANKSIELVSANGAFTNLEFQHRNHSVLNYQSNSFGEVIGITTLDGLVCTSQLGLTQNQNMIERWQCVNHSVGYKIYIESSKLANINSINNDLNIEFDVLNNQAKVCNISGSCSYSQLYRIREGMLSVCRRKLSNYKTADYYRD